jgi:hypothetical protein
VIRLLVGIDAAAPAVAKGSITGSSEKGSARGPYDGSDHDWRMLHSIHRVASVGIAEKAQELYELAAMAGIEKARERLEALKSSSLP